MLVLLLLDCQDNRLMLSLTELSKFTSMIPQEVLLKLGNPPFDQDIIWILINVNLCLYTSDEHLTVSKV